MITIGSKSNLKKATFKEAVKDLFVFKIVPRIRTNLKETRQSQVIYNNALTKKLVHIQTWAEICEVKFTSEARDYFFADAFA